MSWTALFKKDLRFMRFPFLITVLVTALIGIIVYYYAQRTGNEGLLLVGGILIAFHIFYLVATMLQSLSQEWKGHTAHLWLTIPKSGWSLITAKFMAETIMMIISLSLTTFIFYIISVFGYNTLSAEVITALNIFWQYGWVMYGFIIILAMQLGAVATFIFFMHKSIRRLG